MTDPLERQELDAMLRRSGQAAGRLAANDAAFKAAVDSFRRADAKGFQQALSGVRLLAECEFICFWLRSKECVLQCIELCGVPKEAITDQDVRPFADLVVRLSADPAALKRLADAVIKRDRDAWSKLVTELKIGRYCHLICHWVCMIRWRLVCRIVCSPAPVHAKDLVAELTASGAAVRALVGQSATFDQVVKAGIALRCEELNGLLGQDGNCILLCEWICSWRCVLVCLPLCRAFPPAADTSVQEMQSFAKALAPVAADANLLSQLTDAVLAQNADAFAAIVKAHKLEPFCLQLCHWICFAICRRFCICVCPPAPTIPLFTHVGQYKITTNFTADGTTTVGNLAFTSTIPLIGILPDGTAPDALEYHFRFEKYPLGAGPTDIDASMIPATRIGELEYKEWNGASWFTNSAEYWVNNPGATVSIAQQFGPPLVVAVNKDVKPGGWIEVPRENQLFNGGVGRFIPNTGIMANLDTTKLTNETFDLTVAAPPLPLKAGDTVPPGQRSEKPHYKIYFEARKVIGGASVGANNLDKIALSNTHFTFTRHLDWAGGNVTEILVLSLDVAELIANGCSPLNKHVHALFTAYHPYLGSCEVHLEGPGVPPPAAVTPAISPAGEALSPAGGQDFDITGLSPCAYIVWLQATLRLTVGYGAVYGTFFDHIAFCKH
jgi:hypothetical protein